MAMQDPRIHVILPDIGVFAFKQAGFPEAQTINTGICEQLSINLASGMTIGAIGETLGANKKIPFSYTIAPFLLERAFEQIKMACYNNLPIKIVGVGAGLTYSHEGPTHHSLNDIALMRSLPNMVVYSPCSSEETALLTQKMVNNGKPSYIRLTAGPSSNINYSIEESLPFMCAQYSPYSKIAIITTGGILDNVLSALEKPVIGDYDGRFSVYSMSHLWPVTFSKKGPDMLSILRVHKTIITIEEHSEYGGLGTIITELARDFNIDSNVFPIGIPHNQFCPRCGTREEVLEWAGLTTEMIKESIECIVNPNVYKSTI
jgi:transketolase